MLDRSFRRLRLAAQTRRQCAPSSFPRLTSLPAVDDAAWLGLGPSPKTPNDPVKHSDDAVPVQDARLPLGRESRQEPFYFLGAAVLALWRVGADPDEFLEPLAGRGAHRYS